MKTKKKLNIWPYVLTAPALLIVWSVVFIPVFEAISMSLQSYDLRRPKQIAFIGLKNYQTILSDPAFWQACLRTVKWVVFGVGFQFLFGFMLALLLNRSFRGRGVIRSVSLIPWCTPGVLIGLMWSWILDGNYGVFNDLLLRLGLTNSKIAFLATMQTALPSVTMTIVWQGIPFFAIMLLAGLQGIPGELYEAATIDGAGAVQRFRYITLPGLRNTIFVTTLLRIIWVSNSVDVIYNMTGGGPAYATTTLSVLIFNTAQNMKLGLASAMAIIMTLMLSLVAVPYLRSIFKNET